MLAGLANGPRCAHQCFILLRGNGMAASGLLLVDLSVTLIVMLAVSVCNHNVVWRLFIHLSVCLFVRLSVPSFFLTITVCAASF